MKTQPKILTVAEAAALLPQVKAWLPELRRLMREILTREAHLDAEELLRADPNGRLSPRAQQGVTRQVEELNHSVGSFRNVVERCEGSGAHLKDVDQGLVDFYTLRNGELVFLCWKEGEDTIQYWHTLEDGFPGRQPL